MLGMTKPNMRDWLEARSGKLEVLFGYQAPPNAYHNVDGDYVGFLVDVLHVLERQLGYRFSQRDFISLRTR